MINYLLAVSVTWLRLSGSTYDNKSTAFDNFNNSYVASKVTLANESSTDTIHDFLLVADIPTEATVEFSNISTRAANFSLMVLGFKIGSTEFAVEFRKVDFN